LIRYFRINDPYRLVGLLVLLLVIYLPMFIFDSRITAPELRDLVLGEKQNEGYRMYSGIIDSTAPLGAWATEILDSLFGRSILIRHILGFIIMFLQSAYIGLLYISKRVFTESTFIPSFLFALLFFFSWDTITLSNELLGSGFLLLALNNIFQEIEFRNEGDESVFNVGLCIGLASLFAFGFSVYLICSIVILALFTRSDLRKYLLIIFGFLLPHLLVISIAYVKGSTGDVWKYYYLPNLTFSEGGGLVSLKTLLTLAAIPLVYLVISLVMLNREARFSKYQSQILQASLLWLLFSFVFVAVARELRPQTLIVFFPGLSLLLTHFFLLIRRKKFVELNTWILFIGIVTVSYLARFDKIPAVDYSALLVNDSDQTFRGKRILVLGEDFRLYKENQLATPFLNWELSKPIFENPDYYDNVTRVYRAMKADPPEVILDSNNLMAGFLARMPEFQDQYVRQGDSYIRVSN
jgi:hypothetical protein